MICLPTSSRNHVVKLDPKDGRVEAVESNFWALLGISCGEPSRLIWVPPTEPLGRPRGLTGTPEISWVPFVIWLSNPSAY